MFSRRSRQRLVVLDVVRSTMDHPTADWVFKQARKRMPRIGLGTVYRNLKHLVAEGLIREIHAGGHPARFDANTGRHYHVRCIACGRLADLPLSVETRFEDEARQAVNYRVLGHHLEVVGICPSCQGKHIENYSHLVHGSPAVFMKETNHDTAQGNQDTRQPQARVRRREPGEPPLPVLRSRRRHRGLS